MTRSERNQKWEAASRTEKKLMICEDVLSIIGNKRYNVSKGHYYLGYDTPAPEEFEEGVNCKVCARGAMLVSRIRHGASCDNLFFNAEAEGGYSGVRRNTTRDMLSEAFSERELAMIEAIFEETVIDPYRDRIYQGYNELLDVLTTFPKDTRERLKEIMERIISCEGDVEKALTCHK